MSEKMERIGALWANKDKNGNDYMTGVIEGKKVIIFSNKYKKESKHPDWYIFPQQDREKLPPKDDDEVPF